MVVNLNSDSYNFVIPIMSDSKSDNELGLQWEDDVKIQRILIHFWLNLSDFEFNPLDFDPFSIYFDPFSIKNVDLKIETTKYIKNGQKFIANDEIHCKIQLNCQISILSNFLLSFLIFFKGFWTIWLILDLF